MSKVWLITGSGSGLGRCIAEAALEAGDRVVGTALDPSSLAALEERFGARVLPTRLDVADEGQGRAAVRAAVETFGRLDVLVNSAGFADTTSFAHLPSQAFRKRVDTCVFGAVTVSRAALRVMRRQRSGHIIETSSWGGRTAFPGGAAYFESTWNAGGLAESVALATTAFGIKVTALDSGATRANWNYGNGDPVRVAKHVVRLASAEASPAATAAPPKSVVLSEASLTL